MHGDLPKSSRADARPRPLPASSSSMLLAQVQQVQQVAANGLHVHVHIRVGKEICASSRGATYIYGRAQQSKQYKQHRPPSWSNQSAELHPDIEGLAHDCACLACIATSSRHLQLPMHDVAMIAQTLGGLSRAAGRTLTLPAPPSPAVAILGVFI